MPLPLLALVFLAFLAAAYFVYGGWVAQQFQLDDRTTTPAVKINDGVDFVPTRPFYLFAPALLGHRRGRADRRADPRLPGLRLAALPAVDRRSAWC